MSIIKAKNARVVTTVSGGSNGISMPATSFQLPVNMSAYTDTSKTMTTTTTTRNNVSVTKIKCEVDEAPASNSNNVPGHAHGTGFRSNRGSGTDIGISVGIRIPITKAEESDSETELTNIENLKTIRRTTLIADTSLAANQRNNGPRPMSWEGELSETETTDIDPMETSNSTSNSVVTAIGLKVIKSEATTTTSSAGHQPDAIVQPIKSEFEQVCMETQQPVIFSPYSKLKLAPTQSNPINLKYDPDTSLNSPLLPRNKSANVPLPANPSPDSAIHSVYTHSSPSQSPLTSRHAPYTPSLSRNNSDASHSSCYSYSSEFSPTHSPIQGRHAASSASVYGNFNGSLHHSVMYRPISVEGGANSNLSTAAAEVQNLSIDGQAMVLNTGAELPSASGISRQQLINSPCPICGDKISGFHYGIFSCESCKGFFKRTVQNRKNYVCVRGGPCSVSISTRKKCPACRFEKCLQKGMKLEAIREDRTRGGRSTYQCSYTLPNSLLSPLLSPDQQSTTAATVSQQQRFGLQAQTSANAHQGLVGNGEDLPLIKAEQSDILSGNDVNPLNGNNTSSAGNIPILLQEIMEVEHLWQYNEAELVRLNQPLASSSSSSSAVPVVSGATSNHMTNPLLASAGLSSNGENANPDLIAHLCNVADHRLYKIVKWCKSLPLFKNISIDDQICLLINSWCELLLFSCCFRSIDTPGEIKMSQGKKITLAQAKSSGLQACIERMLNLTDHLRRLRVDRYEYVAMKVIVLLQSDTSELQEPVKVRECQEKALQSLQAYTLAHYPETPSKFGELLLRIPDLQRTCQLGKEMLTIKSRDGGNFNLLMELLRGEH